MSGHLPTGTLDGDKATALGRTFFAILVSSWGKWASGRYKGF